MEVDAARIVSQAEDGRNCGDVASSDKKKDTARIRCVHHSSLLTLSIVPQAHASRRVTINPSYSFPSPSLVLRATLHLSLYLCSSHPIWEIPLKYSMHTLDDHELSVTGPVGHDDDAKQTKGAIAPCTQTPDVVTCCALSRQTGS